MSGFIKFYFTSSMLNMFRTSIHPSSGACDFSVVSPHWLCSLGSMCVGVSVWLGWGGIRVAAVAQCLRCCVTNRKVAGSIPAGVIGIFHFSLSTWGRLSL